MAYASAPLGQPCALLNRGHADAHERTQTAEQREICGRFEALASGCKTLAFAKTHAVRAGKSCGTSTGPGPLRRGEPRSLEDPEPALGRLVALGLDLGLQGLALGGRVLDALLLDLLLLAEHVGQEIFLLGFGL